MIPPYIWWAVVPANIPPIDTNSIHWQARFKLHLGHDSRPCLAGIHPGTNGWHDTGPALDDDWVDVDEESIPPHLRSPAHSDYIVVFDITGMHFITVNYCNCIGSKPTYLQLLGNKLFPATLQQTKTAFTFNVLDDFIRDNLECVTSGSNYFSKLCRITSNVFLHIVPVGHIYTLGNWLSIP